jgi:hypothetical protein
MKRTRGMSRMYRSYTSASVWPIRRKPGCKGFKGSEPDVVAALPLGSVLRTKNWSNFRVTHSAGSASKPATERALQRKGALERQVPSL